MNPTKWKNPVNSYIAKNIMLLKLYANFNFAFVLIDLSFIILFLIQNHSTLALFLFVAMFFSINRYINSISFKIVYVEFTAKIAQINDTQNKLKLDFRGQLVEWKIADTIFKIALKQNKVKYNQTSIMQGSGYFLAWPGLNIVKLVNIYHVKTVSC